MKKVLLASALAMLAVAQLKKTPASPAISGSSTSSLSRYQIMPSSRCE